MSDCTIEYILLLRQTADSTRFARVAQLVEHHLAKVGVAGSSPVSRSITKIGSIAFAVLPILVIGHFNRDGTKCI